MELNDSKVFSLEYFSGLVTFEFHERTKDFNLFKTNSDIDRSSKLPNWACGNVNLSPLANIWTYETWIKV